ncbi:2-oxoglutarate dehydrogenase, E2 component, dihydrolipoamide succinyltransferase [Nocardioides sp. Arc9.136]|uniref:2-oxoglutarate dehydrogenase, E2 component, dihydrolipoamide succinyltransferase n=1 Tax=Nocardioides sp. Arc9.136 TaxID=2996826 RepID=UPI002664F897|nr:2-oxoglutarate dehydrogenase, E2 component, dihydrolipoamide succinyltransferase [Nocardioides sp. Arc9.136]WKN46959.1 2-oxoglutarate dehydrogenase, E2 component, dihydrolipoamide succinyltransferase [Nocardioides sp. Arc9.136]
MATEVNLPALGESVTEGTVTRWLKAVGDSVAVDEPLLEVSTDKVDTEIPSPVAGTLLEIKAQEDDTVEVGAVLAVIGDEGESAGDASGSAEPEAQPKDEEQAEKKAEQEQEIAEETGDLPPGDETPEAEKSSGSEQPAASSGGNGGGSGGGSGTPVVLPALGESVTEGTVTRWLKSVGDDVAVDEPLLEVSTDKVDTEIPSPVAGTLLEIKAEEDETVEVGAELAIIGDKGAAPQSAPEPTPEPAQAAEPSPAQEETKPTQPTDEGEAATEQPEPEKDHQPAAETAPAPSSQSPSTGERSASDDSGNKGGDQEQARSEKTADGAGYVTPLVRKLAAQHDVDLSTVEGTGVGGRIRKQDVLDAAKAKEAPAPAAQPAAPAASTSSASSARQAPSVSPSPLRGTTEKISRLRKIIAERMVDSLQTGAQLTQVIEVDVTNIARLRDSVKGDFQAREGVKLSYLPFFAKAAIDALKQHPKLNAGIDTDAGEITYYDRENLAIAVDTEKGLITPVIKDAGDLSIAGLAKKIADVAQRTRTNKIGPDELSGGTFTITNLGSVGALWDTPIINKPQVAILGPGAVVKRPVVIDDPNLGETIAVRHMVYLALTYDHRLVDGADAGRFLQDVKKRLEAGVFDV